MLNDITNCMNETKSLTNLPHQQNNNVKYCRLGSTSTLIKQTYFYLQNIQYILKLLLFCVSHQSTMMLSYENAQVFSKC